MAASDSRPFPPWDSVAESLYTLLKSIVFGTGFCPKQIPSEDLLHDAFLRLKGYYERGIARGNIKKFDSWCRVKAWSAARDERRHRLRSRAQEGRELPLEVESEEGAVEELGDIYRSGDYRTEYLDDVEWGMQDLVRQVLRDHAQEDPESVATLLLYDVEDMTGKEIARLRNKSENVVRDIVYKDRNTIERRLAEKGVAAIEDIR